MATHSRILAWRTPQTEEPGGLESKHRPSDTTEHGQPHGAGSAEPSRDGQTELTPVSRSQWFLWEGYLRR